MEATTKPGIAVIAEALPFETIPADLLRGHLARWLVQSAESAAGDGPGQALDEREPRRPKRTNRPPQGRTPKYVRNTAGQIWVTRPILRTRGWTDGAIRKCLPEPEGFKRNPRFAATGSPMPVWRPETVAAAESTPEWQTWLQKSLHRRQRTLAELAATDDADFRARLEAAHAAIEARLPARDAPAEPAAEREEAPIEHDD